MPEGMIAIYQLLISWFFRLLFLGLIITFIVPIIQHFIGV